MITKKKLLLLIAGTLLFSGCVTTKIEKSYNPILQKIEDTEKYSVCTQVDFQPEFINDPKVIAVWKSESGTEWDRVYLFENVNEWLKKGFDQELKMAGFNVENGQNNVKITLKVEKLFLEQWHGFWSTNLVGMFKIEAKVDLPQRDSYYVRKFVTYDNRVMWGDVMEERFLELTQKGFSEIVKEIRYLLLEKIKI